MRISAVLASLGAILSVASISSADASKLGKDEICNLNEAFGFNTGLEITDSHVKTVLALGKKLNNDPETIANEVQTRCADVIKSSSAYAEHMQSIIKFGAGFGEGYTAQQLTKLENVLFGMYKEYMKDQFKTIFKLSADLHYPIAIADELNDQHDSCIDDSVCFVRESPSLKVLEHRDAGLIALENFMKKTESPVSAWMKNRAPSKDKTKTDSEERGKTRNKNARI